jgi:ABC-type sulfate transport system permease subunit
LLELVINAPLILISINHLPQGRDLMARVMPGGQISIAVGLAVSLVSLAIGVGVVYGAKSPLSLPSGKRARGEWLDRPCQSQTQH